MIGLTAQFFPKSHPPASHVGCVQSNTPVGAIIHTVQHAARSQLKVGSDSEHLVDVLLHCQTFKNPIQTQSQLALVTL